MPEHYLIFTLEGRRCALPLALVQRVERAVEITLLPQAQWPPAVRGVINVHGDLLPVLDVRAPQQGQMPPLRATEQMILLTLAQGRRAALLAESVEGVRETDSQSETAAQSLLPAGLTARGGVLKSDEELIPLHDVEALLGDMPGLEILWRKLSSTRPGGGAS